MKKNPTKSSQDRKQQILDQAEILFAMHGYEGIALSQIAKAAGLGNAGLIHHYPSKAELYLNVLNRLAAELNEKLKDIFDSNEDPLDKLESYIRAIGDWAIEWPTRVALIEREVVDNRERIHNKTNLILKEFATSSITLIKSAKKSTKLPDVPDEIIFNIIIGVMSYGSVSRPTMHRMLNTTILKSHQKWINANVEAVIKMLC